MKKAVAVFLLVLLSICFASCAKGDETPSEGVSVLGMYKAFAVGFSDVKGYAVDSSGLVESTLNLSADGKGEMTLDGNSAEIESWSALTDTLSINIDGDTLSATFNNGIITADLDGYTVYYAKDGADKSSVKVISLEEFNALSENTEE